MLNLNKDSIKRVIMQDYIFNICNVDSFFFNYSIKLRW